MRLNGSDYWPEEDIVAILRSWPQIGERNAKEMSTGKRTFHAEVGRWREGQMDEGRERTLLATRILATYNWTRTWSVQSFQPATRQNNDDVRERTLKCVTHAHIFWESTHVLESLTRPVPPTSLCNFITSPIVFVRLKCKCMCVYILKYINFFVMRFYRVPSRPVLLTAGAFHRQPKWSRNGWRRDLLNIPTAVRGRFICYVWRQKRTRLMCNPKQTPHMTNQSGNRLWVLWIA